ncbi:Glycerol-3-phosphate regulon repressor [Dyadobacter sp. CECT 9275]|uniref:Glycerol-3-phosphate regulon repressor n=1 Tax=Dyadobacter helix TaxID=2822344 RepID=A0A916NDQ6_9BACT|nr:DeoR/GlpR family DNA-binding transcription regulator [Dyadobacter sp. CECT 9275]CAG5009623.1 Glycerol-3-phosphate regulon repressor [Dyadobacter sp. CECT 9275]
MSFQNRKNKILQLVREHGEVNIKELSAATGASGITIRRDLQVLAEDGLIFRTHGGAMKPDLVKTPVDFINKVARHISEKDQICRRAVQLIEEGDTLFMDCGSTVFRLCGLIRHMDVRVITNSLPVVHELMGSTVRLNLIGGELDKMRQAMHGSIAVEHIGRYHANKAFVGVDGISAAKGLSASSEKEAEITMAMAANSSQTYLLCDASKVGRDSYLQFADIDILSALVTNEKTESVLKIQEKGLPVLI